jgi:hypothetical protein
VVVLVSFAYYFLAIVRFFILFDLQKTSLMSFLLYGPWVPINRLKYAIDTLIHLVTLHRSGGLSLGMVSDMFL